MANSVIEPTFTTEADRLTFLSRLWGFSITALDVTEWEAQKLLYPTTRQINETENQLSNRRAAWHEERVARPAFMALSKWDSYKLGKVRREAANYLSSRPNPNRTQAREAVRLQLIDKYAVQTTGTDIANDLLPLVQGIVW